ncbi:hypothetical protein F9K77_07085 [Ochrobactrum sp. LMG 5442]|nr:hypothetical protein F9K77_07085 [Ochrobactrum sp. LMG 5442]
MNKTRIEQFFDDHADALAAYNAKYAEPEPDFSFETKVDHIGPDDEDDDLEDDFDFLDDEPEAELAWGPRP